MSLATTLLEAPVGASRAASKGLAPLADCWDQVAAGSGWPMQQYAWVSACAETCVARENLRILLVGTLQRPAAIAPLVRSPRGLSRLELLGVRQLHEPMDLVYQSPSAATALAEALAELGIPLALERVPAESATATALQAAWRGRGVILCRSTAGTPWLALDERWAEEEPPLAPGRRSDLRRAQRRAEKLGPVSSQIVSPAPHELDALLGDAFQVEATGWKGRQGTALVRDRTQGAFYRRYAAAAVRAGILRLCFLRIGERIAAMQLAVESDERFWLLKIGYDEAFASCSPGVLLLRDTIRAAARRGLRSYEFLGAPEQWIRVWTENVRPCLAIRAYPARPSGAVALTADVARAGWRKLRGLGGRGP